MSLSVSFLGSQAPKDIQIKCFSSLTVAEICTSSRVCKEWFNLLREKVFWIPIYKQLNPLSVRQFNTDKEENIKSEVLRDLRENQKRADLIISLIDDDKQLASLIDNASPSLADLSTMLPFERTMYVMRGLRKNCTQFLVYLTNKHKNSFIKSILGQQTSDSYKSDKSLPCWVDLINSSLGPFNASAVMSAAWSLYLFNRAHSEILRAFATIVKSHQDLSSFFEIQAHYGDSFGEQKFLPITTVVSQVWMPKMQELGLDVTMADLIKCGYKL